MSDDKCVDSEQHHLHICELKAKDLNEELRKLFAETPHFACTNCGAKVSRAENVCAPKALD
jgi:hypothetical protein